MEVAKNLVAALGIIFLIVLVPYILAEGWKGFSLGAKAQGLWLLGMLGIGLAGALALVLLHNLVYVIAVVLGLAFVIVLARSFRK
ncbi:hypothetical protein ES703_62630 [subsurface metagenome]